MLREFLREPLMHFVILGAALFVLFNWSSDRADSEGYRVVVTPGRVEHLAAGFERTWRRPPTKRELKALIDGYIRNEIYYREALALGLDKDDTIVRRRMKQKLEFLVRDAAEALDPSDDQLLAYLREHPDTFRLEPRASFRQVYLSPEAHAGNVSETAGRLLERLESGDVPPEDIAALGDRLMVPAEMKLARRGEIERLFGARFAEGLMNAAPRRWTGPLESGYGLHLVYVGERREARLPELDEVRGVVLREWLNDRREALGEEFYRALRERYTVEIEPSAFAARNGNALADAR